MHLHAEQALDLVAQIDPSPAYDTIDVQIRPVFHQGRELVFLCVRQLRCRAGCLQIIEALQPLRIIAVNPVPQCLPIHPAVPRRRGPVHTVEHQRQRQHPTPSPNAPRPTRRSPKLRCRKIQTLDRHCMTHQPRPPNAKALFRPENPPRKCRESTTAAAGITPVFVGAPIMSTDRDRGALDRHVRLENVVTDLGARAFETGPRLLGAFQGARPAAQGAFRRPSALAAVVDRRAIRLPSRIEHGLWIQRPDTADRTRLCHPVRWTTDASVVVALPASLDNRMSPATQGNSENCCLGLTRRGG